MHRPCALILSVQAGRKGSRRVKMASFATKLNSVVDAVMIETANKKANRAPPSCFTVLPVVGRTDTNSI